MDFMQPGERTLTDRRKAFTHFYVSIIGHNTLRWLAGASARPQMAPKSANPVKFQVHKMGDGSAWYVLVLGLEHYNRRIKGFPSEAHAKTWIKYEATKWLRNQTRRARTRLTPSKP